MDDQELIDSIWEALPSRATRKTRTALTDLRSNLEGRQDPVSVALTKDPGATWDSDQIEALALALVDEFAANGRSKLAIGIFRTVVARWCQLTGHDCPAPAPTFSKKRAKHPRRYGLVRALRERNALREALGRALRATKKDHGAHKTDWLALMILSGLCHFQWLHKDTILASIEACANPETSVLLMNQRVALWYGLPLSGDPHAEQRITILDPLTAVLCLRTSVEQAKGLMGADDLSKMSPAERKAALSRLGQRLNAVLSKYVPRISKTRIKQIGMDACVGVDKNPLGGGPLCAVTRHGVSVVEVAMSNSDEADLTAIVYPGLLPKPSISGTRLDTAASNSGS